MYDLVLKQARVIDPQAGLDKVCDIAFKGGSVAIIQDTISASRHRNAVFRRNQESCQTLP